MPKNKPINLAIIGCGAVVEEFHLPSLRRLAGQGALRVTLLVDRSRERMARLHRYFPDADCVEDIADAFISADAALIASPPGLHRSHVDKVLAHGCDVLCEKPLSVSPDDIAEMAKLAQQNRRILMVGMTRRYFPSLTAAAAMIHSGALGEHIQFRCFEGGVYQWPIASDAPFRRQVGGGGVLMDKGVHVLDSLLWLFGPMNVAQCQDDAAVGGVEANCRVELEGKGAVGTMQLSWDQTIANGLHVKGSLGEMRLDPNEFRWIELRRNGLSWERHPCRSQWPASLQPSNAMTATPATYEDCIHLEWIQFLRSVVFGEPFPVGANEAHTVANQIESAFASAQPLPQPWLPPEQQAAAARRHWKNQNLK